MRPPDAIAFPAFDDLASVRPTWRSRLCVVLTPLKLVALTLAGLSLLPIGGRAAASTNENGATVLLVLDRSGSMERDDFTAGGRRVTRLTVARDIATQFLLAVPSGSPGRRADRVGLVTFAGRPRVDAAPTRDHARVAELLARVEPTRRLRDDGTAIGDALAAAIDQLPPSAATGDRLIVLVTDGRQNAGTETVAAVRPRVLAADVPVHVVALRPGDTIDADLRSLADTTGGRAFAARNTAELSAALDTIQSLRPSPRNAPATPTGTPWATHRFASLPPLLLISGGLLLTALTLQSTVLRVTPR